MFFSIRSIVVSGLLLLFGSFSWNQDSWSQEIDQNRHVFLLVGQSNMAGRGSVEPEDTQTHDRVLMLTKENEWKPAQDPMHFDKPSAGVGLGKTFGMMVAESNPEITVALIPCAVGGSPIASWKQGGYHDQTKSHPYDDTMKRIHVALESGTLKAILWHQGESDCTDELAAIYAAELKELMERFRRELNAPNVPIFVGQLGQFTDWDEATKKVDAAHRDLPNQLEGVTFVSSDDLKDRGDETHFDSAAYREFGKRYAKAYLEGSH